MSALPPKADIRPRDQDICFGPRAHVPRLYWEDLISPLRQTRRAPRGHQKKLSRREPIPPFTFVILEWVGVLPSITPSVLDARPKRSHLMPVYGVIGQEVARVE
jgi:hypothetical protein